MASISKTIALRCKRHAYGEDAVDSDFAVVAYREGDDDDDGGYDYAPAA